MRHLKYRKFISVGGLLLLASVAGLWAWNTLAELFALPPAQYRHVLAALLMLTMLRSGLGATTRNPHRERGGGRHENSNC